MQAFFFKHPIGKFLFDVVTGAILGAAIATLALPESASGKEALGLILGAAQGGARSAASTALIGVIRTLRGT